MVMMTPSMTATITKLPAPANQAAMLLAMFLGQLWALIESSDMSAMHSFTWALNLEEVWSGSKPEDRKNHTKCVTSDRAMNGNFSTGHLSGTVAYFSHSNWELQCLPGPRLPSETWGVCRRRRWAQRRWGSRQEFLPVPRTTHKMWRDVERAPMVYLCLLYTVVSVNCGTPRHHPF